MHPALHEWDEAYLLSIATPGEFIDLEKKSHDKFEPEGKKKGTVEELAKQVCAFSNAVGGFLVYGIPDKATGLDQGVKATVGTTGVKSWVEQIIPGLLEPPVTGCEAKFIQVPGQHAPDRGALVVQVPLSERRPHWMKGQGELAYIRAGEHSYPMARMTFLDISTRGVAPQAQIISVGALSREAYERGPKVQLLINPIVQIESGPVAQLWACEVSVPKKQGWFRPPVGGMFAAPEGNVLRVRGEWPLFPRHPTRISPVNIELVVDPGVPVSIVLSVESAPPVQRTFTFQEVVECANLSAPT